MEHDREPSFTSPRPVLYVEDNKDDVFFFKLALHKSHSPLPLQTVSDGQAAWEYLTGAGSTERPTRPSLIVLDLNLPRKSGLDILQALKQDADLKHIPVIVLTSSRLKSDIDAVYALGADFYLLKSLDLSRTLEYARGIHAFWRSVVEDPDDPGVDPTLSRLRRLSETASTVS